MVSIIRFKLISSNISIGDDFDRLNLEKEAIKKKERFILNRHNYHHPRRPKNKLIELYKNGEDFFHFIFLFIMDTYLID